ncbi:MAG: BMC domain-containing protein [Acetatifactor sp.]|nr:BMC domain-containing protein [Acetatifactor sp.]
MNNISLGFIEVSGVVAAVDALDIMCKTSGVELATWERKLGGRLVTIVVKGDVASVTEAVETAAQKAVRKPAAKGVIANPHQEILRLVELSAARFMKKQEAESGLDERTIQEV